MVPPAILRKVRKVKIGRTPYGLFYTIEGKRLMVIAVQDLRQEPGNLARLRGLGDIFRGFSLMAG